MEKATGCDMIKRNAAKTKISDKYRCLLFKDSQL